MSKANNHTSLSLNATKTVYPLPMVCFFFTAAGGVFLFDFKTVNVKHFPIFLFRWHQKTKTCNFMTQRWIKSVWALTYVRPKGLITEGVICSPGGNTFLCLCRFGKLMTCYNRAKFDSTIQWTWAGGLLLNHSAISHKLSILTSFLPRPLH